MKPKMQIATALQLWMRGCTLERTRKRLKREYFRRTDNRNMQRLCKRFNRQCDRWNTLEEALQYKQKTE